MFGKAKDSGQSTTCTGGKIIGSGTVTCKGPKVTWGSHTGVPHKHSGNKYETYCKSMGYTGFVPGSDKYGTVSCSKGALFGCSGYDFNGWHWWVVRSWFSLWHCVYFPYADYCFARGMDFFLFFVFNSLFLFIIIVELFHYLLICFFFIFYYLSVFIILCTMSFSIAGAIGQTADGKITACSGSAWPTRR